MRRMTKRGFAILLSVFLVFCFLSINVWAAGETVYSVLDPRGLEPERPFQAISPRLDTLAGKKVGVVNLLGGNQIVMTTIAPAIKELVPECNVVYHEAEIEYHQERTEGDWAFIESCDAVIIGHNY